MKKGISLAVLVVTIIVLVILTAATVATITGENGVIDEARLAASDAKKSQAKEKLEMELATANIRAVKENKTLYQYILENYNANTDIKFQADSTENNMIFNVDGYSITVNSMGELLIDGETSQNPVNPNTPQQRLDTITPKTVYLSYGETDFSVCYYCINVNSIDDWERKWIEGDLIAQSYVSGIETSDSSIDINKLIGHSQKLENVKTMYVDIPCADDSAVFIYKADGTLITKIHQYQIFCEITDYLVDGCYVCLVRDD